MERQIVMAVLKLVGKAALLTLFAGIVVGVIAYLNKWDTSLQYSNAFFVAACVVIVGCAASRLGGGQQWEPLQRLNAYRAMNDDERRSFIDTISGSFGLVIVGLLSGVLLILLSWLMTKIF